MSLVCTSPLAAMVIQPFVGVTIVQQNVITVKGQVMDEKERRLSVLMSL